MPDSRRSAVDGAELDALKANSDAASCRAMSSALHASVCAVVVSLGVFTAWFCAERFWSSETNCRPASRADARGEMESIGRALEDYARVHEGRFPAELEALGTPDENGRVFSASSNGMELDPWNNPFQYERSADERWFRLTCFAKDGQPGGRGEDEDIEVLSTVTLR